MKTSEILYKCAKIASDRKYNLNVAGTTFRVYKAEVTFPATRPIQCKIELFLDSGITPEFLAAVKSLLEKLPISSAREFGGSIEIEYCYEGAI